MVLSTFSIHHHYPEHCRLFFIILNLQLLFLSSKADPLPCLFCHPEPALALPAKDLFFVILILPLALLSEESQKT